MYDTETEGIAAAIGLAIVQERKAQESKNTLADREYLVLDHDQKVHVFEPVDRALGHVHQTVKVSDAPSFIAYFNRFKKVQSQIFVRDRNMGNLTQVVAVIDYHHPGEANNPNKSDFADHKVEFTIPYSEEWKRWSKIDGQRMGQREFAEFLEENYLDVVNPPHADLLSMVLTLQAKKDAAFSSATNLQNGDVQFQYTETTKANGGKGTIDVPKDITVSIPVFNKGACVSLKCFLRYSIADGALSFTIKINRRQFAEDEALQKIVDDIAKATAVTPYMGSL